MKEHESDKARELIASFHLLYLLLIALIAVVESKYLLKYRQQNTTL